MGECLDSMLNQTFADWECICIDDGSTDRSGRIADEYARRDSRLKVVHKTNGGEGSARNAGLEVADGDWIYFIDADDVIAQRTLEICNRAIDKFPETQLASVKMLQFQENNSPDWPSYLGGFENIDITEKIDNRVFGLSVWTNAYRKNLIRDLRFSDLKVGADRVFVAQVIEKARNVTLCDYVGYGYRTRMTSISNVAMNAIKFTADLEHRIFWINIFKNTAKLYSRDILDKFAKDVAEYMAHCFFSMSKQARQDSIKLWCDALKECSKSTLFNRQISLRMGICGALRSQVISWLLCYFPYWLKAHGINRQFKIQKKHE